VLCTGTKEGKKKQPKKNTIWREGIEEKIVYVLAYMVVTFPTSQAERSRLKALAMRNTAPHSNSEKSKDKNG